MVSISNTCHVGSKAYPWSWHLIWASSYCVLNVFSSSPSFSGCNELPPVLASFSGDARGLVRVAWAGVGLGTCPRSCERWLCRCMRRAQGSAGAASSRAPSAGITASDSDPSVRRHPPPLLRDASVPHTHPGIRMVAKASFRVAVRCHEAALRCGPAHSSCNCLVRADPQAPGVPCDYQDISLAWLGLDLLDFLTTAQR